MLSSKRLCYNITNVLYAISRIFLFFCWKHFSSVIFQYRHFPLLSFFSTVIHNFKHNIFLTFDIQSPIFDVCDPMWCHVRAHYDISFPRDPVNLALLPSWDRATCQEAYILKIISVNGFVQFNLLLYPSKLLSFCGSMLDALSTAKITSFKIIRFLDRQMAGFCFLLF